MHDTDRELLMRAAKAAGIEHAGPSLLGQLIAESQPRHYWSSLHDYGDALRLAVQCKIFRRHMDLFHRFYEEEIGTGSDETDATLRAITRAAATLAGADGGSE